MCIRRASRGRLDLPVSWKEVAGNCGGLAAAGVGPEDAGWVVCGAGLLEAGASNGGVRGCIEGAAAVPAGLGEDMAV